MERLKDHRWVRCVLTGALLLYMVQGMSSPAQATVDSKLTDPLTRLAEVLHVKPGPLSGRILYPGGDSPAKGTLVRLWDCDSARFISVSETDRQGRYTTRTLDEGRYLAVYGDRVYVRVDVTPEAHLCSLDVIVPRGKVYFTPRQMLAAVTEIAQAEVPGAGAAGAAGAADASGAAAAGGAAGAGGGASGGMGLLPAIGAIGGVSGLALGTLAATGAVGGGGGSSRRGATTIVQVPTSPSSP